MPQQDQNTNALQVAVAAELRLFRLELERVAELLVSDDYFVTTYLDQLQVFDLLGQCADESAAILDRLAEGVHPTAAIGQVRLDVMVNRLRAAMLSGNAPPCVQAA